MIKLCKGTSADLDELKDFINLAFLLNPPIEKLAPKTYAKDSDCEKYHYLIKENGRIRGALCALPVSFSVCGQELHSLSIGAVSVHRDDRNKGYMQMMVNAALEDARKEGWADFSMLGGNRQRYGYFGYESGGLQITTSLLGRNVRHALSDVCTDHISINAISPNDTEMLARAAELYCTEPIHALRDPSRFYEILVTWAAKPYAVFDNGKMIGYVVLNGNVVSECVLEDYSRMEEVACAVVKKLSPDGIVFQDSVTVPQRLRFYENYCESYSIDHNKRYLIFRYEPMICSYLTLKASLTALPEGELVLGITGYHNMRVKYCGGKVTCEETDASADIVIPADKAVSFLFSPMRSVYGYNIASNILANAWFPLPLFCPRQDVN